MYDGNLDFNSETQSSSGFRIFFRVGFGFGLSGVGT
jgi:hypothetical protein